MSDKLIVERLQDLRICDIGLRRVAAKRIKQLSEERGQLREAALREAADSLLECSVWCGSQERTDDGWRNGVTDARKHHMARILALIDKPAHVNETPKSEHDERIMLAPNAALFRGPA